MWEKQTLLSVDAYHSQKLVNKLLASNNLSTPAKNSSIPCHKSTSQVYFTPLLSFRTCFWVQCTVPESYLIKLKFIHQAISDLNDTHFYKREKITGSALEEWPALSRQPGGTRVGRRRFKKKTFYALTKLIFNLTLPRSG